MKKYSYNLRNINIILTFLIVFLHSSIISFVSSNSLWYNFYNFLNIIYDCAVPTFIFISSYLFYRNYNYKKYKEKVFSRIKSLLIPYFLWNIIFYLFYSFFGMFPQIKMYMGERLFSFDFSSAFNAIFLSRACPPLWFLRVLFIFCIMSPLILFIIKKCHRYILFSIILLLCFVIIFLNIGYSSFIFWLPLHIFGAYISVNIHKYNIITKNRFNSILLAILYISLIICCYIIDDKTSILYFIYRFVSPFIVIYYLDIKLLDKNYKIIVDSFFIYCIHFPIIEVVRKILITIFGLKYNLLIYFSIILITLFVILLISIILKKYLTKLYYILIGGREY